MKTKPNLFIIGGPKCGTTAFVHMLKQHKSIKWVSHREIDYFCKDITILHKLSAVKNSTQYLRKYFNFEKKIIVILVKDHLFIFIHVLQLKIY